MNRTNFYRNLLFCDRIINEEPYKPEPAVPSPETTSPEITSKSPIVISDDEDDKVLITPKPPRYYRLVDHVVTAQETGITPPLRRNKHGYLKEIPALQDDEEVIVSLSWVNTLVKEYNQMKRLHDMERCLNDSYDMPYQLHRRKPIYKKRILKRSKSTPPSNKEELPIVPLDHPQDFWRDVLDQVKAAIPASIEEDPITEFSDDDYCNDKKIVFSPDCFDPIEDSSDEY